MDFVKIVLFLPLFPCVMYGDMMRLCSPALTKLAGLLNTRLGDNESRDFSVVRIVSRLWPCQGR